MEPLDEEGARRVDAEEDEEREEHLEAEVDAYTEWRRARQAFQVAKDAGMSAKDRKANRITNPGPEPAASIALVRFFEKMTNYNPVVALLDVLYVDRTFGFDSAVESAATVIRNAFVEATSCANGVGIVKLMGNLSTSRAHTRAQRTAQRSSAALRPSVDNECCFSVCRSVQ